jgi:hypothetical protein
MAGKRLAFPADMHTAFLLFALTQWSAGFGAGGLLAPGEIGRDRNATGGQETLIARWRAGAALAGQARLARPPFGIELAAIRSTSVIRVENEAGTEFPHHGQGPLLLAAAGTLVPFGASARIGPFVSGGLGLVFIPVDLDNVKGQTLFVSPVRSLAAGFRFAPPNGALGSQDGYVELRVARYWSWGNGPLRPIGFTVLMVSVGMST